MSWTYEVVLRGGPELNTAAQDWFAGAAAVWGRLPGLVSFDRYSSSHQTSDDPFNHAVQGPLMLLMLDFATADDLRAAVGTGTFGAEAAKLPDGIDVTGAAMERRFYPAGAETKPAPLTAPFSYVVRYQLPAEDRAAFVADYIDGHPSTQARLPGIRSIMCYLPLDEVKDPALPTANYLVGNEVVFDDIDAFNVAMRSPVRLELREHFHKFPPFSGINTHYPMQRVRVVG